jgi:NAD-dependent dihydropyrimidine dehydrogenase PreA subunit
MSQYGLPREAIPWFPTIDVDVCAGCQECFDFCGNGVYEWDDMDGHPVVAHPYNCVIGCSACAKICATEAISFPTMQEINALIQGLRQQQLGQAA